MGKQKLNKNDYEKIIQLKQEGYSNPDLVKMFLRMKDRFEKHY